MRYSAPVLLALAGALGTAAPARILRAQSKDSTSSDDESHQVPPTFATGATVGALRFAGGRTENAMSVIFLYHPLPWLKLSSAPGYGRTSLGATSSSGLTDVPFSAVAAHSFDDASWSPSIAGGLAATLARGDSAATLGLGSNTLEASAALSISPAERLSLSADVAHPVVANSGNGSVSLESSLSFGRATGNVGLSAEVGRPDSGAVLSRSLAAGVAWTLRGPLTLTLDGSHGVSGSAPTWALSIGVGTAFAGISPLSPTSALKRLNSALGKKTTVASGYAKSGAGSTSCRRRGTC